MENERNQMSGDEQLDINTIETEACKQFVMRLDNSVQEYIAAADALDNLVRAERASRALATLLQHVDGHLKKQVILN
jgi:hypothetical protein